MKRFKRASELHEYIADRRLDGAIIGFIPTLGALHQGHLELVKRSLSERALTICSIFVNPTQFNNSVDFARYPKTLDDDILKLETAGTDILFIPEVEDIYPGGTADLAKFDLGYLETILEGSSRPGHFQGVCQVMQRLLTIVDPHLLFMGQKDYQQCLVVKRLLEITSSTVKLITAPTVRRTDGLALSSRNARLSDNGRIIAKGIFETLSFVKQSLTPGDLKLLLGEARQMLAKKGFVVDYVEIAHAESLLLTDSWDGNASLICLIAAFLEEVRLIDNMVIS